MEKGIDSFHGVLNYLNKNTKAYAGSHSYDKKSRVEEIRLRNSCPLSIYLDGGDVFVSADGGLTENSEQAYIVTSQDISSTFNLVTNHSVYAFSEDI